MAKSPKTSKPKSPAPTPNSPEPQTEDATPTPLSAKDHIFAVAQIIARARGFDPKDADLWVIVEEQFTSPHQRVLNRYNRNADEMLCQTLERDERFQEAVSVAKGQVF